MSSVTSATLSSRLPIDDGELNGGSARQINATMPVTAVESSSRAAAAADGDDDNNTVADQPTTTTADKPEACVTSKTSSTMPEASSSSSPSRVLKPPMVEAKKYSANDFKFIRTLGDGSFSTVYLGKLIETNRSYAVKACDKRHILRANAQASIKREREVLQMLNLNPSPFFVKLFCTFQDASRLYFVLTYAKHGELLTYIIKVNCFDAVCTQFYAAEVILALEHLHSLGIIHRDLKPENILLNERMHVLLTDFGSAAIEGDGDGADEEVVPPPLPGRPSGGAGGGRIVPSRQASKAELASSSSTTSSTDNNNSLSQPLQVEEPTSTAPIVPSSSSSAEDIAPTTTNRVRRRSFVGTADYVPPELLTDKQSSRASDLWALGCLVYQLLAGLPPFRAATEWQIFQKIIKLEYTFPEGFDPTARDLVNQLLVREPSMRLGHDNRGGYANLKKHKFFARFAPADWDTLHTQQAPDIAPSLATSDFPERSGSISVAGLARIEPGLDERQITRLMGINLDSDNRFTSDDADDSKEQGGHVPLETARAAAAAPPTTSTAPVNGRARAKTSSLLDMTDEERQDRLKQQASNNQWHRFVENNLILKQGFVEKKKGLFPRRRMLLLTTGPHLYYVDPATMVLKGEIPWSPQLRPEVQTFRIFFVHTPNRAYYLIDPDNSAVQWCDVIENVYTSTYGARGGTANAAAAAAASGSGPPGEAAVDSGT